jgi:hypothetical protein
MRNKRNVLTLFFIIFAVKAFAQFEISAELRPRFELNNGFGSVPTLDTEPTAYIAQRSRLNFTFNDSKYRLYVSLQDVRNWGDEDVASGSGAFANSGSFGIHQFWAEFSVSSNAIIKVGRQEFKYDDQRLLSTRNWNQFGQTYDAILFSRKKNNWQFDLAVSYNNDNSKGEAAGFGSNTFDVDPIARRLRTLNFIYIKKQISDSWYVSTTAMLTGYQKEKLSSTTYLMGTYGLFTEYKNKGLEGRMNLYGQSGKSQKGLDVNAFMFTAEASYRKGKIRPGIGIDMLSGNDGSHTDPGYKATEHAFDVFYGVRYARYGFMNQYVVPGSTLGGGLVDIYPQLHFYPDKKSRFTIDYHFFSLQQKVKHPKNPELFLSGSLGSELDLVWHYNFSKELFTTVGYSYYFTNDTFASVKKIDPEKIGKPYFVYVMLTFKPLLFRSGK